VLGRPVWTADAQPAVGNRQSSLWLAYLSNVLKREGCKVFQDYYYGRSMPSVEFEESLLAY
jgi:hypothetical protein